MSLSFATTGSYLLLTLNARRLMQALRIMTARPVTCGHDRGITYIRYSYRTSLQTDSTTLLVLVRYTLKKQYVFRAPLSQGGLQPSTSSWPAPCLAKRLRKLHARRPSKRRQYARELVVPGTSTARPRYVRAECLCGEDQGTRQSD